MWIVDYFKSKSAKSENNTNLQMLNGTTPVFSNFGDNIYVSDVVQQAISCIVFEMKKLSIKHIRESGFSMTTVSDSQIQWVLDNPNSYMTQSDFIEKICWNLLINFNSYIVPAYDNGKLVALYPIKPSFVTFKQYLDDIGIEFRFENGYTYEIPYSAVIHLRYRYSKNELLGGNANGKPDFQELYKTLEINNTLMENIPNAIKSSYQVLSVVKYNTIMDKGKTQAAIDELLDNLASNRNGILPLGLDAEYTPIQRNLQQVDEKTLKFIDEKILRTWGVSLPILTGDFNKEQYEAFYQKCIEPLVISFSQAFTKALFTEREKGFKNKIQFYAKELCFMNTTQKIEFIKELGGRGALTNGFMLSLFGIDPSVAGDTADKRMMSLNYIDASIANEYQMNNSKSKQQVNDIKNIVEEDNGGAENE